MQKIFFVAISLFFFMATSLVSEASNVFFIPQSSECYNGDTFIKDVYLSTNDKHVNVVSSEINFDPNILEAVDIIKGESIIELWTEEPTVLNEKGLIKFSGGIPNGYKGNGLMFKVVFRAKNEGDCRLNFSKTEIFLNDGEGTKDDIGTIGNNCSVIKKLEDFTKITSGSHPNENKWYNDNHLNLRWDPIVGVEYSYLLSRDSFVSPDTVADKPEGDLVWMGSMSYRGVEDGIYYFHLRQKLQNEEWSQKITFRAMVDTMKPEKLFAQVTEIEGKKYLIFNSEDKTSGVEYYKVAETKKSILFKKTQKEVGWKKVSSPYLLRDQDLESVIRIRAVDKAGNEERYEISPVEKASTFQKLLPILLFFVVIITIWVFLRLLRRRNKK